MKKKIFLYIFGTAFLTILIALSMMLGVTYQHINADKMNQLTAQTQYVAKAVETEGMDYLKSIDTEEYRLTFIAQDGRVLYDSVKDITKMENHRNRQEFIDAQAYGIGRIERQSTTMLDKEIYVAQKLNDGSVVRISTSVDTTIAFLWLLAKPLCFFFVLMIGIAVWIASRLSKRLIAPLNRIDLDSPLENDTYEEMAPFLGRIHQQHKEIAAQKEQLNHQHEEFQTVVDNMKEGIVLLNSEGAVLSMNKSAEHLLDVKDNPQGKNILTIYRHITLQQLLEMPIGKSGVDTLADIHGRHYVLNINPVLSNDDIHGWVLLFMDRTEKIEAEILRKEFSANVSHELKTPLHSISGCAELLMNDIVKEEDKKQFIQQIYQEASHMNALIDNIIKISKMDENKESDLARDVSLEEIVQQVFKQLSEKASKHDLKCTCHGKVSPIHGIPALLYELVFNLCDNAIKYNHPKGFVDVSLTEDDDHVILSVTDNGQGIPAALQERVFERFYRADKSHSRAIEGSGLGLSIVKHIAQKHCANIVLESDGSSGTTIRVSFKKNKKSSQ